MSDRLIKPLSIVLGILMFMFGFLKFFQPFHGWFDVQIQQGHLPHQAILAGKIGEIVTGILFLLPWLPGSLTTGRKNQILLLASFVLFTQMAVAIYVHLQPGVPASVLPLGIKRPFIPVTVLLLGALNASAVWRRWQAESSSAVIRQ